MVHVLLLSVDGIVFACVAQTSETQHSSFYASVMALQCCDCVLSMIQTSSDTLVFPMLPFGCQVVT